MSANPIRVLLVEDDEFAALFVTRLLDRAEGAFCVELASSAITAMEMLETQHFDAILLDLGLPDSSGFDTVLRIRTSFPAIPVVVLTGVDDEEMGIKAIECGAHDFLSKQVVVGQILYRSIRYAIARHNQITHLKALARTDALTGLPNRRALDVELKRVIAGWKRTQTPFSVALLDIDHFKKINDTHGHRMGDFVLSRLADVISETMRESDLAARFGGEEFAILLPNTSCDEAVKASQRWMADIRGCLFEFEERCLQITASIGLAEMLVDDDASTIIERADQALYAAKKEGRDRAYLHNGQGVAPTLAEYSVAETH